VKAAYVVQWANHLGATCSRVKEQNRTTHCEELVNSVVDMRNITHCKQLIAQRRLCMSNE